MNEEHHERALVLELVRRVVAADGSDAERAMADVVAATDRVPLRDLAQWDRSVRGETWPWRLAGRRFPVLPPVEARWLWVCCGDGRLRERAFRLPPAGAPNALFFALALRRLNDWVPQVRDAARASLPAIAAQTAPEHVAEALWATLPGWTAWRRAGPADREVLIGFSQAAAVADALRLRLLSASSGPAARVLEQVARGPALDRWLDDLAARAVQPAVRAVASRWRSTRRITWIEGWRWVWTDLAACEGRVQPIIGERRLPGDGIDAPSLHAAAHDRSPMVRRVAADILVAAGATVPDALLLAARLARDPSPSVAVRGRYADKKIRLASLAVTGAE